MLAADRILTVAGRDRLEQDLVAMKTTRRRELAGRVAEAREGSYGDEADVASLVEVQEEQMLLELRIAEMEQTLAISETIQVPAKEDGLIRPGSTVTFRDEDGVDAYELVGPAEANPRAGRISITSPVGQALLGHRVGDEVEAPTPSGIRLLLIEQVE
jgi:transcription elongation factor GreA